MKKLLLALLLTFSVTVFAQDKYMKIVDDNNQPNGYAIIQEIPCEIKLSEKIISKFVSGYGTDGVVLYNGYIENSKKEIRRICWYRPNRISENHEPRVLIIEEVSEGDYGVSSIAQYYFKDTK